MTDDLANAGPVPAASESASFSGQGNEAAATPPSEPRGMRASFEGAKAALSGERLGNGDSRHAEASPAAEAANKATSSANAEKALSEALKAPDRWEQGWKDSFAKVPPDVQKAWLDQHKNWETGYNKRFEDLASTRKFAESIQAAIPSEVRQDMQQRGYEPAQAIGRLFQLHRESETNPAGFIQNFMRAKGIDPRIFLGQQGADGNQQAPAAQQFAPFLQPLLTKIAQLEQGQTAWQAQQQAEHDRAIESAIVSFQGESDESGSSKYPHLERVGTRMAELIEHDPRFANMDARSLLEEAYQSAVFSDPALRAEMVSAEASRHATALETQRTNGRLQSAATARPASSFSVPAPAAPRGMRGSFEAAKRQLGADS